jgi:protocatechuate 3,4-dioxygenase beta subunit
MDTTMNAYDGCTEFDERLLEAAFGPTIDASLDRHIARCSRCARARDLYLTTADVLAGVLSTGEQGSYRLSTGALKREPRPAIWKRGVSILAAASILVAALWIVRANILHRATAAIVSKSSGAIVELVEPNHVIVRQGTAEIEAGDEETVVDTPLGSARAKDAKFSVSTRARSAEVSEASAAFVVTIAVTSGLVRWSSKDEHDVSIAAGEKLVRPLETRSSSVDDADRAQAAEPTDASRKSAVTLANGLPANLDPALATKIGYRIRGTVIDRWTAAPIAGARVHFASRLYAPAGPIRREARGVTESNGVFALRCSEVEEGSMTVEDSLRAFRNSPDGLSVEHDAYGSYRLDLNVADLKLGSAFDFGVITLDRGLKLSGRVVDATGQAVAHATLFVGHGSDFGSIWADAHEAGTTDHTGQMILRHRLSWYDGNVLVALSDRGLGWLELPIREGGNEWSDAVLTLEPTARLVISVHDENGAPIADAAVKVEPTFKPFWTVGRDLRALDVDLVPAARAIFTGKTDSSGILELPLLPAPRKYSAYRVAVEHKGQTRTEQSIDKLDPVNGSSIEVTMPTYRSCAVSGRVTDVAGKPIEGASIGGVKTDVDGRYRVTHLDPSQREAKLTFRAKGFVPRTRKVTLPAKSDVTDFDVVLETPTPIDGVVVDESGTRLAGARVMLTRGSDWVRMSKPGELTDSQGSFAFDEATAGAWNVEITGPKPEDSWARYDGPPVNGGDHGVALVLHRAKTQAQVPGAHVTAVLLDADTRQPIDPVNVAIFGNQLDDPFPEPGPMGIEQRSGRVEIAYVPQGSWTLWVKGTGRSAARRSFSVAPGQSEITLELVLGRTASIRGTVVLGDVELKPKAIVWAHMVPATGGPDWLDEPKRYGSAEIDSDRAFLLEDLVPGRWRVSMPSNDVIAEIDLDLAPGQAAQVQLVCEPAAHVVFTQSAPPAGGNANADRELEIHIFRPDELESTDTDRGAPWDQSAHRRNRIELALRAGHYRWKAIWRGAHNGSSVGPVLDSRSGEVDATVGATREIDLSTAR